jgi:hypothetical protein
MKATHCLCFILATVLVLGTTGCASIVSDSDYPVSVDSSPSGATFEVKDSTGMVLARGTTPQTIVLEAGEGYFNGADYIVEASKGGDRGVMRIGRGIDLWYLGGNLFFGGLIGYLIVDPLTGAMWKLDERVVVPLR